VFVGWGRAGAEFLAKRLPPNHQDRLRVQLISWYNTYCGHLGLSPIVYQNTVMEQQTARRLLGYFESEAVPVLLNLLESPSEASRVGAIQAMSELGPNVAEQIGPHLVPLLNDPSPTIQYEAITTLSVIGYDPDVVIPLITPFLQHQNDRLRIEASYAIGSYPPQPTLTLELLKRAIVDPDRTVKGNVIRALGKIGKDARTAINPLSAMLERGSGLPAARVVEALPFIAEPGEFENESAYQSALNVALAQPDTYYTMMACRGQLRLNRSSPLFQGTAMQLIKSGSNWRVWETVDALSKQDPMPGWVRTLLETATRHPNGLVRAKARAALDR